VNEQIFDVIVVGGGPGGATCAWKCAEAGLNVLVLDRAPAFPRYKPCGGGLPASICDHVSGLEPEKFADLSVTNLRHSWKGKDPVLAEMTRASGEAAQVWMVQRPRFDAYLLDRAQAHGAKILTGKRVSEVALSEGLVTVTSAEGESWSARHVVGADGAKGIVGGRVGLRIARRYGIAREIEIPFTSDTIWHPALEPSACYLDYGTVKNGYAWIFPKSGFLSVGAGMLLPKKPTSDVENNVGRVLKRAVDTLLESVGMAYPEGSDAPRLWGHPIPYWTGIEPLATPGGQALLVGDAAGVVQPLFGEGIQYAMRSGAVAAECIVTGMVKSYTERLSELFGEEFDTANRVGKLFHAAPYLSYKLGVKNPSGTRLVGRLMSGDTSLTVLEERIRERLMNPARKQRSQSPS
jgi:geranylgeranyl reductase family protein